ncbi:hypothetical protein BJ742DRAFT_245254 [Cladochytrium replicatum]|nr:hypothetical protein BJ742DRAFT_245254 [Cladochytrium replicatum]
MLTHMTKGRPKASKKKGSGPHDDEADAEGSNDQLAEHEESSPLDIPATQSPTIIHTETHHAQSPLPPARRSVVSVDVAEKDQFGGDSTDHPSVGYSKQESDAHVGAPGPAPPVKPRKPPPSSPVSSYSIDSSECRRISEEPAAAEHGVVQRKSVAIPDDKAAPGSVSPPLPPSRRPPVPTPSPARKSQHPPPDLLLGQRAPLHPLEIARQGRYQKLTEHLRFTQKRASQTACPEHYQTPERQMWLMFPLIQPHRRGPLFHLLHLQSNRSEFRGFMEATEPYLHWQLQ